MTATALGEQSAMHKTKVSRAVAELERRRWLTRTPDENDRRVEHLALTKAGLAAYREMVPLAKAFERELLARLSAERAGGDCERSGGAGSGVGRKVEPIGRRDSAPLSCRTSPPRGEIGVTRLSPIATFEMGGAPKQLISPLWGRCPAGQRGARRNVTLYRPHQSITTLPELPLRIASNPVWKSSMPMRCVIRPETSSGPCTSAIILYQVSNISRP